MLGINSNIIMGCSDPVLPMTRTDDVEKGSHPITGDTVYTDSVYPNNSLRMRKVEKNPVSYGISSFFSTKKIKKSDDVTVEDCVDIESGINLLTNLVTSGPKSKFKKVFYLGIIIFFLLFSGSIYYLKSKGDSNNADKNIIDLSEFEQKGDNLESDGLDKNIDTSELNSEDISQVKLSKEQIENLAELGNFLKNHATDLNEETGSDSVSNSGSDSESNSKSNMISSDEYKDLKPQNEMEELVKLLSSKSTSLDKKTISEISKIIAESKKMSDQKISDPNENLKKAKQYLKKN